MGRVYSVSDGTINNSHGVPYIMASPMDLSFQDVVVNIIIYYIHIMTKIIDQYYILNNE